MHDESKTYINFIWVSNCKIKSKLKVWQGIKWLLKCIVKKNRVTKLCGKKTDSWVVLGY